MRVWNTNLAMLPAELWPPIAASFSEGEALRLMLLGCRALSSKLRSSLRDLKFVWFSSEYADWNKCLKSLDNFNHPEHVSLSSKWVNQLSVWPVTWQLLTPQLKSLSLSFHQSVAALFADTSSFDSWQCLEHLRIEDAAQHGTVALLSHISLANLPRTLRTLYLHSTSRILAPATDLHTLPPLLRIFDTNIIFGLVQTENQPESTNSNLSLIVWPSALEKLVLNLPTLLVDVFLLPNSLTYLKLSKLTELAPLSWTHFSWTTLFPHLRHLIIPSIMRHDLAFKHMTFREDQPTPPFFPPTLTELYIPVRDIPLDLRRFYGAQAHTNAEEDSHGVLSQLNSVALKLHGQLGQYNIALLPQLTTARVLLEANLPVPWPSKLTSLTVDRLAALSCVGLPATLTTLNAIGLDFNSTDTCQPELPPKLTSIRLERCHPRILLALPPTIRKLDVPLPTEVYWEALNSSRGDGSPARFPFLDELHVHDVPEFSSAALIPDSVRILSARLRLNLEDFPYHPWWRTGFQSKSKLRQISFRGPVPLDILLYLPKRLQTLLIDTLEHPITDDFYTESLPRNLRSLQIQRTRVPPRPDSGELYDVPPPISVAALICLPQTLTFLNLLEYRGSDSTLPPLPIWALPPQLSVITDSAAPEYMNRYGESRTLLSAACSETIRTFASLPHQ